MIARTERCNAETTEVMKLLKDREWGLYYTTFHNFISIDLFNRFNDS
jgi:hypothetical protein